MWFGSELAEPIIGSWMREFIKFVTEHGSAFNHDILSFFYSIVKELDIGINNFGMVLTKILIQVYKCLFNFMISFI